MRLTRKSIQATLAGLFILSIYGIGPVIMGLGMFAELEEGGGDDADSAYSATLLTADDVSALIGDLDGDPAATDPVAVPEEVVAPPVVPAPAPVTPPVIEPVAKADAPAPEPAAEPAAEQGEANAVRNPNHPGRLSREERLARLGEGGEGKGTPSAKKKRRCEEGVVAIEQVEPNSYRVERDLVDYYTSDISEAEKLAYVSWHRVEGEIVGFKVRKIRCGSVLYQAGFRNGDVILSINDKPVTSIPQALLAYRKLRKKNKLDVEVIRKDGQPIHLRYKLT